MHGSKICSTVVEVNVMTVSKCDNNPYIKRI